MKTVIYHNADFDGIFCREIAKKFLGTEGVQYLGWNFGDPTIDLRDLAAEVYVMDLPMDKPFGCFGSPEWARGDKTLVWIDHHKSSIESHPKDIPGYRIDGVAACRLAWQWFDALKTQPEFGTIEWRGALPQKQDFIDRKVSEPLAVRLAGEYDVWQHEPSNGKDITFQFGLRSVNLDEGVWWKHLLADDEQAHDSVKDLLDFGKTSQEYARRMDAMWLSESWHIIEWEGLKFLAQNSVQRGSGIFESKDKPETGHDALMLYGFRGKLWTVSMYHAAHRKDIDLSKIAVKHGGGGHAGACGFTCEKLPFL